jgi:hypothetical protein
MMGLQGAVMDARGEPAVAAARLDSASIARLRARNDRILVVALVAFLGLLTVAGIEGSFAAGPPVLAIGAGLVIVMAVRRRGPLQDWMPLLVLGLAYELIRLVAAGLVSRVHVEDVIVLERGLFGGGLPTEVLQAWLHPRSGLDAVALAATMLYVLHSALPFAVGGFLWLRARADFYDFMAVLIVLSAAAFMTYLVLPVAPPWWAAAHGLLAGADGQPGLAYLNGSSLDSAVALQVVPAGPFGLQLGALNPDPIASFPSLHAAYPFLAYLFGRHALGVLRWAILAYAAAVWFAVIYMGDHYVLDVAAGVAYAAVAYGLVVIGPRVLQAVLVLARPISLDRA